MLCHGHTIEMDRPIIFSARDHQWPLSDWMVKIFYHLGLKWWPIEKSASLEVYLDVHPSDIQWVRIIWHTLTYPVDPSCICLPQFSLRIMFSTIFFTTYHLRFQSSTRLVRHVGATARCQCSTRLSGISTKILGTVGPSEVAIVG